MIADLRGRKEWQFFAVLPRADRALAIAWWAGIVLRGLLPAVFAIAIGRLVGAVERGEGIAGPLAVMGTVLNGIKPMPQPLLPPTACATLAAASSSTGTAWGAASAPAARTDPAATG